MKFKNNRKTIYMKFNSKFKHKNNDIQNPLYYKRKNEIKNLQILGKQKNKK